MARLLFRLGLVLDAESSRGRCLGGSALDLWLSLLNFRFLGSTERAFLSRPGLSYDELDASDGADAASVASAD